MRKLILSVILAAMTLTATAQTNNINEETMYIGNGIRLHDEGKYDEAIKMFDKALKINPNNPTAIYEKAFALHLQGKKNDAIKLLEKGIKKADKGLDYPGLYILLGSIYDANGETDKSIETYEAAMQIEDVNTEYAAQLMFNLGITCYNAHQQKETEDNKYAGKALSNLDKAFVFRPFHSNTNLYLFKLYVEFLCINDAMAHLSIFSASRADEEVVQGLDDIVEELATMDEQTKQSLEGLDKTTIEKIIEINKQPRSEYGILYDVFNGVFSSICKDIKDEAVHPYELLNDTTDRSPILCLYAKLLREGELETFMHLASKASKSGHIANSDWCLQHKDRIEKLKGILAEGQYLTELKDYKNGVFATDMTEDQAHNQTEEAVRKMELFLKEKPSTDSSNEASQFILNWIGASPDVIIVAGDKESLWLSEERASLFVAYSCGCSLSQLKNKKAEFTTESYVEGYKAMLKYYEDNRDVFGAIPALNNYINQLKADPKKFEENLIKDMPKTNK